MPVARRPSLFPAQAIYDNVLYKTTACAFFVAVKTFRRLRDEGPARFQTVPNDLLMIEREGMVAPIADYSASAASSPALSCDKSARAANATDTTCPRGSRSGAE